jgi:hypothetical protein
MKELKKTNETFFLKLTTKTVSERTKKNIEFRYWAGPYERTLQRNEYTVVRTTEHIPTIHDPII